MATAKATTLVSAGEVGYLRACAAAGLPMDSALRFAEAGYCPQPRQLAFHAAARSCDRPDGPEEIGFGGARGGGKSKAAIAQVALDDCQRHDNLKFLFLRKVGKSARESFEDLRRQTFLHLPHNYKSNSGLVEFPNGSRIFLGHFRNDKDIDAYLGLEYDGIVIEEDTQLSASKKRDIKTCLRTSKQDWRPRTYRTTNPGGVDHIGFKREFIEPWRREAETKTRFIPATVLDNVFVNKEYRSKLEALVGWQRAAWLDGDWDIAAGQYFSTWNYEAHTCKPLAEIPAHWPIWAALDYGFTHPTAAIFFTEFDGTIYVIAEHVLAKALPSTHADAIHGIAKRFGRTVNQLAAFVAGADVFAQKGDGEGRTIAQQYEAAGIKLTAAAMDRVSGWGECLKLLGDPSRGIPPRIKIFDTCIKLIETIPALQHNPNRPEDVLKWDVDDDGSGGDDAGDAWRYGLLTKKPARALPGRAVGLG